MRDDADAGTSTGDKRLYSAQRQQAILQSLLTSGRVDASDVAAELGVTSETVRKDLIALERQGQLRRVHGGAIPVHGLSFEPEVSARVHFAEEKRRIAKAALKYVPATGTVLFDSGTTPGALAEIMPVDRHLTVFTNTLPIALTLVAKPNLTVYTLGGRVRRTTLAEVDSWAARTLAEINVDVAFVGTNGISVDRGLTTPDAAEGAIKRAMLAAGGRRILLADHSKFGLVSTCKFADLADIDLVITDVDLPNAQYKALRAAGVEMEKV
jgi:DeoR family fructose operon transcriptional repressor